MGRKNKISNKTSDSTIVDTDYLLAYLEGTLPHKEQHDLEAIIEHDPFLNDAIEGLSYIDDKDYLKSITAQINIQLKKQIDSRRQTRHKSRKIDDHWGWVAVAVILILCVMAWLVIHAFLKK